MPRIGPIKRRDLIKYLRTLEFDGPFPGGNHQYMMSGALRVRLPNPHRGDIDIGLLKEILEQAHITRDEWEAL